MPNAVLRGFTREFNDPDAQLVVERLQHFGDLVANARLPQWWFYCWTAIIQHASNKEVVADPLQPGPVRPIGVGNCLRRAVWKCLDRQHGQGVRGISLPENLYSISGCREALAANANL